MKLVNKAGKSALEFNSIVAMFQSDLVTTTEDTAKAWNFTDVTCMLYGQSGGVGVGGGGVQNLRLCGATWSGYEVFTVKLGKFSQ